MTHLDAVSDTEVSIDQGKNNISSLHHDHRHKVKSSGGHHQDYGMAGVILHIAGDAINNVGVIIAGLIVWKTDHPGRFYADPAVSLFIALMILISAIPLGKCLKGFEGF
jgi:zinc transporter 1